MPKQETGDHARATEVVRASYHIQRQSRQRVGASQALPTSSRKKPACWRKMNDVQRAMMRAVWYWNIILKGRQHGISTQILLLMLDTAMFYPNSQCGLVDATLTDARRGCRLQACGGRVGPRRSGHCWLEAGLLSAGAYTQRSHATSGSADITGSGRWMMFLLCIIALVKPGLRPSSSRALTCGSSAAEETVIHRRQSEEMSCGQQVVRPQIGAG